MNNVSSKQMSAFGEELVKARRVLNEGGGARGSKARKTAKGSKAMSCRSNRQYPAAVPPSLTKEACNGCMPPGARCSVDGLENRYRVVFKPWGCFSRSWTLHGEAEAYRLVCCWAWSLHTSATAEGCPIAGVMVDPDTRVVVKMVEKGVAFGFVHAPAPLPCLMLLQPCALPLLALNPNVCTQLAPSNHRKQYACVV